MQDFYDTLSPHPEDCMDQPETITDYSVDNESSLSSCDMWDGGRDFWTIYSRTCRQHRTTLCMRYYVIWAHGAPRSLTLSLTLIWRTLFRKETVIDICLSTWIIFVYITMDSPEFCLRILFETVQRTNQTFSFVSNILFETTERLGELPKQDQ